MLMLMDRSCSALLGARELRPLALMKSAAEFGLDVLDKHLEVSRYGPC